VSANLRRRNFITLLGGAAVGWPFAARAQQADPVRRIGVLIGLLESDQEGQARLAAFRSGLEEFGWSDGRNIQIDYRWAGADPTRLQASAAQLVALKPEVIFAASGTPLAALHRETLDIPIVFTNASDPVSDGFVASWARPGGNITGFPMFEYSTIIKWLELLKQFAPQVTRAAIVYDPSQPSSVGLVREIEPAAVSLGVQLFPTAVRDAKQIEQSIKSFATEPNGSLIVLPSTVATVHRQAIIKLAALYSLPALYPYRLFVAEGGMASYAPHLLELYRRAASYVDRILKGEKAADLPIQTPDKYELVINLQTAKALGLEIPPTLLARADEVIE
jgi:putative ABC transport system substrate-binding protein